MSGPCIKGCNSWPMLVQVMPASATVLAGVVGQVISVTLDEIVDYVTAEVHPYVPDAWVDYDKTKVGYEVPLTRHFYVYVPPRPLEEIDAEIRTLDDEIQSLLRKVTD